MHIHLPGRSFFIDKPLSLNKVFQVCPYFAFSGLFLDDMVAASSTSPGCLYRLDTGCVSRS